MQKINIIIAESEKLVRQAIISFLRSNDRLQIAADTANGEEVISLTMSLLPDIIILDTKLGGCDSPGPIIKSILKIKGSARIICLSNSKDCQAAKEMFGMGVNGFISKNASAEHLMNAIVEVHSGRRYICEEIKQDFLNNFLNKDKKQTDIKSITKREKDIISYINKGLSSKEIATVLSLSIKTVEVHRYNIYKKLNINKATTLVNYMRYKISA